MKSTIQLFIIIFLGVLILPSATTRGADHVLVATTNSPEPDIKSSQEVRSKFRSAFKQSLSSKLVGDAIILAVLALPYITMAGDVTHGGFENTSPRDILNQASEELAEVLEQSHDSLFPNFKPGWDKHRLAQLIRSIVEEPALTETGLTLRGESEERMFTYRRGDNEAVLVALKPFFEAYRAFPSDAKMPAIRDLIRGVQLKLLHEASHVVFAHDEALAEEFSKYAMDEIFQYAAYSQGDFEAFAKRYREKFGASKTNEEILQVFKTVPQAFQSFQRSTKIFEDLKFSLNSRGVKSSGGEISAALSAGFVFMIQPEVGIGIHRYRLGLRPHIKLGMGVGTVFPPIGAMGSVLFSNFESEKANMVTPTLIDSDDYNGIAFVVGGEGSNSEGGMSENGTSMNKGGIGVGFMAKKVVAHAGFGIPLLLTLPTEAGKTYLDAYHAFDKIVFALREMKLDDLLSLTYDFQTKVEHLRSLLKDDLIEERSLDEIPDFTLQSIENFYQSSKRAHSPTIRNCARWLGFLVKGK